jgi:thiopeptide-type bacteriocin biosynthesis protein
LLAELHGDLASQDHILTRHLPDLLERLGRRWDGGLPWWFVRFRNPGHHLRLRLDLPTPADFGAAAAIVSSWTDRLHHAGLLKEVCYPTSYPETGRWGDGPALAAVEEVFRTDSAAVLTQMQQSRTPSRQALTAAACASIAVAFFGSTADGMSWLVDNIAAAPPGPIDRALLQEAVLLADPSDDWAALRSAPGGPEVIAAWAPRDAALVKYRRHLSGSPASDLPGVHTVGVNVDDVVGSLLHLHHARAYRIDFADEAIVFYLARAAAKRWIARRSAS